MFTLHMLDDVYKYMVYLQWTNKMEMSYKTIY